MSDSTINCIKIDAKPFPLIFPSECVAQIITDPELVIDSSQQAKWMAGYVVWNGQEVPLLCFENLVSESFERPDTAPCVTVLNPIPKAARKTYGAILSFGTVTELAVAANITDVGIPAGIDRRYCEAAFEQEGALHLIPRLTALGVAYSYY